MAGRDWWEGGRGRVLSGHSAVAVLLVERPRGFHAGPWVGQVAWVASDTFATVCAAAFEPRPRKMVPIILGGVD